jgi:hypothetical protein
MAASPVIGCKHSQPITSSSSHLDQAQTHWRPGLADDALVAAVVITRETSTANRSETVSRAPYPETTPVQHVRVHHRRAHVGVPKQLLHSADVIPGLQQVCRE